MRLPYATRHLVNEYRTIAKVVSDDSYLEMNQEEFVARCMQQSSGLMNPLRSRQIYFDLMKDAGLTSMNSPMKSDPDDNGDHSWEYYVGTKLVKEDEFRTAHNSYFE